MWALWVLMYFPALGIWCVYLIQSVKYGQILLILMYFRSMVSEGGGWDGMGYDGVGLFLYML